jgi:hypothetical protein
VKFHKNKYQTLYIIANVPGKERGILDNFIIFAKYLSKFLFIPVSRRPLLVYKAIISCAYISHAIQETFRHLKWPLENILKSIQIKHKTLTYFNTYYLQN